MVYKFIDTRVFLVNIDSARAENLFYQFYQLHWGWSGGAMELGKLPVPGSPTNLDDSRTRAYCACTRCGWGLFGHFYSQLSFLSSFSISLGDGPI